VGADFVWYVFKCFLRFDDYANVVIEEERIPYAEGWRPPAKLDQTMMNHAIFKLIEENPHKAEEAETVGLGTFHALEAAILSLIKVPSPSMCVVM